MRLKAALLLVGLAALLAGLTGLLARRAEIRDDHRQAVMLAASLSAARIDASIANAATTLLLAPDDAERDRLAAVLGMPVCDAGDLLQCSPGAETMIDGSGATFADRAIDRAYHAAADAARRTGAPSAQAASASATAPATAIVVVVLQTDRLLLVVIPLDGVMLVPEAALGDRPGSDAGAPLASEFGDRRWWAQVDAAPDGLAAALRWPTAVQIAAGLALTIASVVAIARDHRGLWRRATIDALTGLPNRAEFERRATRVLTKLRRDGRGACLIVVDLDGFKSVNDLGGHAAGDRVLAAAGMRLAAAVRSSDLVGRWGGDEFVLLLGGIGDPLAIPERTEAIARCLGDLSGPELSGPESSGPESSGPESSGTDGRPGVSGHQLTASVGAAVFPVQGADLGTLLEIADRAMYAAKDARAATTPVARSGDGAAPAIP